MKRTKLLLSTFVALLLAVFMAFSLTACGNGNNNGNDDGKEDQFGITDMSKDTLALKSISVSGNYKTEFALGSAFSSEGLVVTATLNDYAVSDMVTTDVVLNAGEYEVDSSDYVANRVGTYIIYVSYTRTNVTCTAHYYVTVKSAVPEIGGIVAKLAEGATNTYTLSESQPTITISKDILEVYALGADGSQTLLLADKYNADLYLGSQKVEGNVASQNGTYSLVVSLVGDASKQDFISIYVINGVVKIELNDNAGSVFEQEAGSVDSISGTWQFTVTYSNGTTKTLKAGDAGLTIDIDTKTAGANKTGTITYTENGISVTCTVTYTIIAKAVEGDTVNYVMYYTVVTTDAENKVGSFVKTYGDNEDLDSNVTITNTASNFLTREKSTADNSVTLSDYAEIKEAGNKDITISVGAKAQNVSVKVYVSHTSSSATRTAYLASATTADDASKVVDSKTIGGEGNLAVSNLHVLEGELVAGTTYHVFTSGSSDTMHVYQIVVTYSVVNGSGDTTAEGFIINMNDIGPALGATETTAAKTDPAVELKEGTGVYTTSALDVDYNKKTVNGEDVFYRLKLGGAGKLAEKSIRFENLKAGATITIYGITSSSGDTTRTLSMYDSTGTLVPGSTTEGFPNAITQVTFTVTEDGTFYIWGSAAINIYYIAVSY